MDSILIIKYPLRPYRYYPEDSIFSCIVLGLEVKSFIILIA